ncbi:hypothetical protein JoomaDRAFT_2501 [Galbibacter orientalis DSM 19592]|uniref:Uncharacterized protein n=1 Tax=Galbibacter orientalis DSM 19592 TaxID=926559 RepID=I3C787_9FLAO|nr:hypothetical protein JoomaDRAFT_2501 [Galbibacter orientalis DSM 19592]
MSKKTHNENGKTPIFLTKMDSIKKLKQKTRIKTIRYIGLSFLYNDIIKNKKIKVQQYQIVIEFANIDYVR